MAHREVCQISRCPDRSHARLRDPNNTTRRDLCIIHAILTKRKYGEKAVLVEEWGEPKVFDDNGEVIDDRVHFETEEEAAEKEGKPVKEKTTAQNIVTMRKIGAR